MNQELPSRKWLGVLLVLAFGCSGCVPFSSLATPTADTEVPIESTLRSIAVVTETQLPPLPQTPSTSVISVHDPETRVGIEDLDYIIDIVLEGNVEKIRDVLVFNVTRCTLAAEGLGGPPRCREGESEGTLVEVLPFLGWEGHFLRRDEVHEWPGIKVDGLYAAYRVSEDAFSDENYPAGKFAIIFIDESQQRSVFLQVDNGGIVRIDYVFGESPKTKLMREADEVILPPPD